MYYMDRADSIMRAAFCNIENALSLWKILPDHSPPRDSSHDREKSVQCVAKESLFVFRRLSRFAKLRSKKFDAMNTRTLVHLCLTCFFVLGILWVMGAWPQWAK